MLEKSCLIKTDIAFSFGSSPIFWEELRGKSVFITGGTGFFGIWLLESFIWANENHQLNANILVLSRNPDKFISQFPHLGENASLAFCKGDVRNFEFPNGQFTYIIHAATTSATDTFYGEDPLVKFETVANGTKRMLEFAASCGTEKILLVSSGSAYGRQPSDISHIPETYAGGPLVIDQNFNHSALGEGKRVAELLCNIYAAKYGFEIKIARCFSFLGPFLPLDIHYAVGNFIADGLQGRTIQVKGDGTAIRAYLYSSDLIVWLWTILFKGEASNLYNVGSENAMSIAEIAHCVANAFDAPLAVNIAEKPVKNRQINQYVPSTEKARNILGLRETISIKQAIAKTIKFYSVKDI